MRRQPLTHGCDQAIFPFTVATPDAAAAAAVPPKQDGGVTPDHAQTADLRCDGSQLYLTLREGERIRVLQRGRQHGSQGGVDVATGAAAPTQWCIAQREDGAVGLVPDALLHRTPGRPFTLRTTAASTATLGPTHRDPVLAISATADEVIAGDHHAGTSTPLSTPRLGKLLEETRNASASSEDEDVDDVLQLQRRRQTSLRDRVQLLQSSSTLTERVPDKSSQRTTVSAFRSECSKAVEPQQKEEERAQLLSEVAHTSAELDWLKNYLVPRLCAECDAAQLDIMAEEKKTSPTEAGATVLPSAADDAAAVEKRVAEQVEVLRALEAWLERKAALETDDDEEERDDASSLPLCEKAKGSSPPFLSSRDTNCLDQAGTRAPEADSYRVEQLRRLVKEENATVRSYHTQRRTLQLRLSSLEKLTAELAAEKKSLEPSEMALKVVMAVQTDRTDETVDPWPRSLPGLTEEEEAALRVSLATIDKYARKLHALGHATSVRPELCSSLDASDLLRSSISAVSSVQTTPEKASQKSKRAVSPGASGRAPLGSSADVVDHLRQVLENGDRECLQLESKTKTLREFCDTYGPAARDIDAQLKRGFQLVEEKREYLAQL